MVIEAGGVAALRGEVAAVLRHGRMVTVEVDPVGPASGGPPERITFSLDDPDARVAICDAVGMRRRFDILRYLRRYVRCALALQLFRRNDASAVPHSG